METLENINQINNIECNNSDCKVQEDGICIEGHSEVSECPNIQPIKLEEVNVDSQDTLVNEITDQQFSENTTVPDEIIMTDLPDGSTLSEEEIYNLSSETQTQLIILAGAYESGKTTLLASIWQLFLDGPFAGYLFAGSFTLPGFEERCHLSMITSERAIPITKHTGLIEKTILHLKVNSSENNGSQNLLFSDLAGEWYRLAKDSVEECKKITLLSRADHITILIDGKKLIKPKKKHEAFSNVRMLLRSFIDAEMVDQNTFVEIVFAKWDLIEPIIKKDKSLRDFIEIIKKDLQELVQTRVGKLTFFQIAARPEIGSDINFGYNLDKLFKTWVQEIPERSFYYPKETDVETREIDRFK